MGANDVNALLKGTDNNGVALCDVDESGAASARFKTMTSRAGWEPLHAFLETFPAASRYRDYRVMLEKRKDIDAVGVTTPDHSHAVVAMAAMQLGKHVYVQKPRTRTISEACALTEAARRYKVVAQMGNQGHSAEGVRVIEEWIADGAIGKVHEVRCWTNRRIWPHGMPRPTDTPPVPAGGDWDLWLGPVLIRPYHKAYHPFGWRSWLDFGCGAPGDMGCHVMDAAYTALEFGHATSVQASIVYNVTEVVQQDATSSNDRLEYKAGYPPASVIHYTFAERSRKYPSVKVHWCDGGMLPKRPVELEADRRLPTSSTIFVGEKQKLICAGYSGVHASFPSQR